MKFLIAVHSCGCGWPWAKIRKQGKCGCGAHQWRPLPAPVIPENQTGETFDGERSYQLGH